MNSIDKLIQIFSQFPGVGPRQARRFVYHLLTRSDNILAEFSRHIDELKKDVAMCADCQRFFQLHHSVNSLRSHGANANRRTCKICSDPDRDHSTLMIVQRDADLESVEKNGGYEGLYFVLGGVVPILEKEPQKKIRIMDLESRIKEDTKIEEIILGVNWNPEGENTADYIVKKLKPLLESKKIKVTHLGKGLSMGTELEYTDSDTLKNALKNRS